MGREKKKELKNHLYKQDCIFQHLYTHEYGQFLDQNMYVLPLFLTRECSAVPFCPIRKLNPISQIILYNYGRYHFVP